MSSLKIKLKPFFPLILVLVIVTLFVALIIWQTQRVRSSADTPSAASTNVNNEQTGEADESANTEMVLVRQGETKQIPRLDLTVSLQSVNFAPCVLAGEENSPESAPAGQPAGLEPCQEPRRGAAEFTVIKNNPAAENNTNAEPLMERVVFPTIPGMQRAFNYILQLLEYKDEQARLLVREIEITVAAPTE